MFDNLRESASSSPFYEDELIEATSAPGAIPVRAPARRNNSRFLGMNAQQRFIVSSMLLFTVCLLGTLAMFVLGKMSLF